MLHSIWDTLYLPILTALHGAGGLYFYNNNDIKPLSKNGIKNKG